MSQLFGGLSKALTVEAEDKQQRPKASSSSNKHIFDRAQVKTCFFFLVGHGGQTDRFPVKIM